jgi:endogenous inhibitor of DNA gyrase (YacG/DUF329 family)
MTDNKNQKLTRLVPCPTCQKMGPYSLQNPFRPFCSERCKIQDTAQWASEGYRIPSKLPPEEEELSQEHKSSSPQAHSSSGHRSRDPRGEDFDSTDEEET